MADLRSHGVMLGLHAALGAVEPVRARIDTYHLTFAAQRRPQVSWQDLGRMLRVNAEDLRRHYERWVAEQFAVVAKPADDAEPEGARLTAVPWRKPPPSTVSPGTLEHQALAAVGRQGAAVPEVADQLERDINQARTVLGNLQRKGLVAKASRFAPYALTPLGERELERLEGGA